MGRGVGCSPMIDDRSGSEYLVHNVFSSLRVFAETDQDKARVALDQSQWEAFTLGKTALRVKEKNPLCELVSREHSRGVQLTQ